MASLQETLRAKVQEVERLIVHIKTLPRESEEGKDAIRRWAAIGDETQRLMILAEEQLTPPQLARLKAACRPVPAGWCIF